MLTAIMFFLSMILLTMIFFVMTTLENGPVRTMLVVGLGLLMFMFWMQAVESYKKRNETGIDSGDEFDRKRLIIDDMVSNERKSSRRRALRRLRRRPR